MSKIPGLYLLVKERMRQIEMGYTAEHDGQHRAVTLTYAGRAYEFNEPDYWPWDHGYNPKDPLSDLIRAGALYLASNDLRPHKQTTAQILRVTRKIDRLLDKAREVLSNE